MNSLLMIAAAISLLVGEKPDYTIVAPPELGPGERFLLDDMKGLLGAAAGGEFAETTVAAAPAAKRIFFGIAPADLDAKTLADQEYVVTRRGDDVYLVGGGPSGTRLAVYDFLEHSLGFRFWDARGNVRHPTVAELKSVTVQERRRRPSFLHRYMNGGTGYYNRPKSNLFLYRNGQNAFVASDAALADNGANRVEMTPDDFRICGSHAHSIPNYVPDSLFGEHPEFFTMNASGERVAGAQVCFSQPGLRKHLGERILENMRRHPDKNIYDCSARDTPGEFCLCPGCRELTRKYGSVAGPLVDFVREFAPRAAKEHPGNFLMCLAYRKRQSEPPPKGVDRLPDNFMPDFAPIDDNFAKDWTDPSNAGTYENLKGWCRLCRHVTVWYYPNPYGGAVTLPLGNVARVVKDVRLMHEAGVTGHMMEHNVGTGLLIGFTELQSYLMLHLFLDVEANVDALAKEFIDHQYGPAAKEFTAYWKELERIRREEPLNMNWSASPGAYVFLTAERLMRWQEAFDRMEALAKDDPERLFNLQRVRLNLDYAVMTHYPDIRKAGDGRLEKYDFYAERALRAMERAVEAFATDRIAFRGKTALKNFRSSVEYYRTQSLEAKLPLPPEIAGKFPKERIFSYLPRVAGHEYLEDGKAAYGKTAWFDNNGRGGLKLPQRIDFEDHTKRPPNHFTRDIAVIKAADLGPRGEYRFYECGEHVVSSDCTFRFGVSDSWDIKANVGNTWKDGSYNRVRFFASLKFEGPAYYPEDKGRPNRVYCDRVVAVQLDP